MRVVLETHSETMVKWLSVCVSGKSSLGDESDRSLLAVNRFPYRAEYGGDDGQALGDMLAEQTKPFADLYIKGI